MFNYGIEITKKKMKKKLTAMQIQDVLLEPPRRNSLQRLALPLTSTWAILRRIEKN